MSIFKKKKTGNYNVLNEKPVPASLPTYGFGLESFVTADYPMNDPDLVEATFRNAESNLADIISTCDHHSIGNELDHYIDAETDHSFAAHEAAVANNENQIARIRASQKIRKNTLEKRGALLEKEIKDLESAIESAKDLTSQFQLHIGGLNIPVGAVVTIIAMIVDAALNYSFLQNVLFENRLMLGITVACMSVMSDGSMWALGTLLSRKDENFMPKPLYRGCCVSLAGIFVLSIVGSVMIRWGSMDSTYGAMDVSGQIVAKSTYSLAEYGITLITSFCTASTGILSFVFSVDEKAHKVAIREAKSKKLSKLRAEYEFVKSEQDLIANAPDPEVWDKKKRAAAQHQIEATRRSLKLHCRKLMTVRINEADFTERMAASGKLLLNKTSPQTLHGHPLHLRRYNRVIPPRRRADIVTELKADNVQAHSSSGRQEQEKAVI